MQKETNMVQPMPYNVKNFHFQENWLQIWH